MKKRTVSTFFRSCYRQPDPPIILITIYLITNFLTLISCECDPTAWYSSLNGSAVIKIV